MPLNGLQFLNHFWAHFKHFIMKIGTHFKFLEKIKIKNEHILSFKMKTGTHFKFLKKFKMKN